MRISSDLFPFASHEQHGYPLDFAGTELERVGQLAKELRHRLTMHPGQYMKIASPREEVVRRALADLEYHAHIFQGLGMSPQDGSVMVIHMGMVTSLSSSGVVVVVLVVVQLVHLYHGRGNVR